MINFTCLPKLKIYLVYIFFYLISAELAISQSLTKEVLLNLEDGLNKRDLGVIKKYFNDYESKRIEARFSRIISDFPNSKWTIKNKKSDQKDKENADINISASKIINGKEFIMESNFNYYYSLKDGKIENGIINNHLTTIRNDKNSLDIDFSIPDSVLTGKKYDIDIIINKPLEDDVIAGGLKSHQVNSIIEQNVKLEPLVSGGIFKVTRAPLKPGMQVWSGIIAHKKGLISFTKTVQIIQEK